MKSSKKKKTNKINKIKLNLHMNAASLLKLPPWQQRLSTHDQLPITVPITSSRGLKPYRSIKFSKRSNNNSYTSTERQELPNLTTGKQVKDSVIALSGFYEFSTSLWDVILIEKSNTGSVAGWCCCIPKILDLIKKKFNSNRAASSNYFHYQWICWPLSGFIDW